MGDAASMDNRTAAFEELPPWRCPVRNCGHENPPEQRRCGRCGVLVCGARTRSGTVCRKVQVLANGRCSKHAGKSLSGPAHPNYKHGRYWKVLPVRLDRLVLDAGADPDQLSMAPELRVLDARVREMMGRLDSGESAAAWRAARDLVVEAVEARREHDLVAMDAALSRLVDVLERPGDAGVWAEIDRAWDRRMRFVESERRRLLDAQMYVTVGHVAQVFGALTESLRRNVRDPHERQGVVDTMRRLLGKSRPAPVDEAS